MPTDTQIKTAYEAARNRYAEVGVDVDAALAKLKDLSISLHCWQGDDVAGLETAEESLGGGLAVTGNYPGVARTGDELRADIAKVLSLLPGKHRLNLHAMYAESEQPVDRDKLAPEQFSRWIDFAKGHCSGFDFNPTCFSHPMANDGFTLSHPDRAVRSFWIDHCIACRKIGEAIGAAMGTPCVTNVWIPDGMKDTPADRLAPRARLTEALDAIFAEAIDEGKHFDSVEPKLFGIGSESYVVGSHDFYLAYAVSRKMMMTIDSGHYHPTEDVGDKISSVLNFCPRLLLHVSRGVRWDSDHVVTLNDDVRGIMSELVRGDYLSRTFIGLDYFDASINRIAAWVIGTRCAIKALLEALLEPQAMLVQAELEGDFTTRLAMMEEAKTLPSGAVWDMHCLQSNVPPANAWLSEVKQYEADVLSKRA